MKRISIILTVLVLFAFIFSSCVESRGTVSDLSTTNTQSKSTSSTANSDTKSDNSDPDQKHELTYLAVYDADGIDEAATAFAIDMLKLTAEEGKNTMISPLSILTALGMTSNGAGGDTLTEMEAVLFGGKSIAEFNDYYKSLTARITNPQKGVLSLANSVWYRDDNSLSMKEDFLNLTKNNYECEVRPADFNDPETALLINNWVKDKTNDCIDKIVDKIEPQNVIYLINALYFEQQWQHKYTEAVVSEQEFYTADETVSVPFMYSEENYYIEDSNAVGFSKPYEGEEFSFVAIMPDEGITAEEYLQQLNGKKLLELLKNREKTLGKARLPKFKSEFSSSLVEPLKELGIKDAFDKHKADFEKMATSTQGNIWIGDVMHKTFIEVNETGTKAAAVTSVEMVTECAPITLEYTFDITLNRPFIYMIIDERSNLPLFIGIMNNPEEK